MAGDKITRKLKRILVHFFVAQGVLKVVMGSETKSKLVFEVAIRQHDETRWKAKCEAVFKSCSKIAIVKCGAHHLQTSVERASELFCLGLND